MPSASDQNSVRTGFLRLDHERFDIVPLLRAVQVSVAFYFLQFRIIRLEREKESQVRKAVVEESM